jgi:HK97 family phage prohead protease
MPVDNVPQFIRNNAQRGLDYLAEGFGGDGLTDATKREAREMADGNISDNKVRKMAPWFARHKADGQAPKNKDSSDPEYPGAGLVAWLLWGGNADFDDAAQDWAQRQIDQLDNETNKARSKMKKTERRTFTVRNIEARQADDGTMRMAGYAAVFNEASLPLPFIEKIAPGAFTKTLQETPDVRLLANHEGLPMARTKNGTMRLYEDETGLYFEAELANTQEARDMYTLVERGDVDQMSFAFRVIRQNWSKDRTERTLTEVSLADGDVSIVTYPAYPATSVEAREALKKAVLQIKEGREVTGDSLLVLESVFGDLSEGHEYIMKAVEVMGTLLGNNGVVEDEEGEGEESQSPLEDVEEQELEMSATNVIDVVDVPGQGGKIVGDFPSVLNFLPDNMPRSMSLRLAQAKRNTIK